MKKFLLFACVAFATISANAQKLTPTSAEKSLVFAKQPVRATNIQINHEIVGQAKNMSALAEQMQKAPEAGSIYGTYIEDAFDEIHACSEASLSSAVVDGKEVVKMVLDNGVVVIYGTYDAETGVIDCGYQTFAGGGDATGYDFEIFGIEDNKISENLSFTIDDDKNITCNQEGYVMYITTEGDYNGYTWDGAHFGPAWYPVNAIQAGFHNGRSTSNKWVEYNTPIYVEDWGETVVIYNFCGMSVLSIDINEDGTVSAATGQPLYDPGFDETQIATYGQYFNFTGVDVTDDGKIQTNAEKEAVAGTINGNTITLTEYFRICSLFDETGSGYALNWYADGTTFTLNEGNYILGGTTGIDEITTTREEKIKNTKTYNLMGQQVDRANAKGILIRDGKKYIKKF